MDRYTEMPSGLRNAGEVATRGARALSRPAGLLVLAYVLSKAVLRMDPYYVISAALALLTAIVLSARFELGFLLYTFIAPLNIGGSPAVLGAQASYSAGVMPSQAGLACLSALWIARQVLGSGLRLVHTRLNVPVVVFLGVAVASAAMSYIVWDSDIQHYDKQLLYQVSEVGLWALCAAAFFLTANAVTGRAWLASLYWPIIIVALYVMFHRMSGTDMIWGISRNAFILAYATILTTARLLLGTEKAAGKIGLALLLVIFLVADFWNRSWVSGWLAASLGAAIVLVFYSRRAFVAVALISILVLFAYPGLYHSVYHESRSEGDLDRLHMWGDAVRMAANTNPILGIGPAAYLAYSQKYGSVWYGNTTYTTAHSDYAQIIAELGLLGILAFLWMMVAGIKAGLDAVRQSDPEMKWLAVGGTAVFASMAFVSVVGDYILPSRVNGGIWSFGTSVYPWLLLGAAVAAARSRQASALS